MVECAKLCIVWSGWLFCCPETSRGLASLTGLPLVVMFKLWLQYLWCVQHLHLFVSRNRAMHYVFGSSQLTSYCLSLQLYKVLANMQLLYSESRLLLAMSHTHTHTQSQNHGEYVFDVGSESRQQNWISSIKSHSANLAPSSNGHLPA